MELKRTARDITGNCRDFPGQKNVRIGIQAAAGYAFAMGILEKYRQAEGYDLPSASFVYPDARREEEDREAVRELAAHLSFINRIHISYLNQSYERNYYWNMRLRCEQLFLRLSGSTVFGREVRELREIYQELAREQEAASAQTADRERLSEGPGQGEADRRESFPEEERERTRKKEQRLGEILRQTEQKIMKRAVTGILKKDFMDRLPSRQASASWQSEPARQFFWQVQRSPRWEQEILFRAAGVGSLPALEKRLARIPEKRWGRELEILKETTRAILQDRELLETLLPERLLSAGPLSADPIREKETAPLEGVSLEERFVDGAGRNSGAIWPREQLELQLESYLTALEYLSHPKDTENERIISRDKEQLLETIRGDWKLLELAAGEERKGTDEKNTTGQERPESGAASGGVYEAGGSQPGARDAFSSETREAEHMKAELLELEIASMTGQQWMEWKKHLSMRILETLLEMVTHSVNGDKKQQAPEEGRVPSDPEKALSTTADGAGPLQEKASFQRPETGEWKTQLAPAVRALKRAEQWSFRRSFLASAAEAVSYLGLEEWTLFKEGLSDAFPAEPDIRLTEEPFFAWLMEQKGTEKPESPEGMSREKNGLIQALAEQSVPDRIFGPGYESLRETLEKSRILAPYLQTAGEERPADNGYPGDRVQTEKRAEEDDENAAETFWSGIVQRIRELPADGWRIFLKEFKESHGEAGVNESSLSWILGETATSKDASGQEDPLSVEEEKQRVLEYLGRKTDLVREPAKAHRAAWIRDDRADLAKEQMPAPEGPGEESEDRSRSDAPSAGSREPGSRLAIRMAERVLELIKHGGAFDQNFSGDPSEVWEAEGKGNRWTIRADRVEQALDRAETWTIRRDFLETAAEAVSYLGLEEWSLLKKELIEGESWNQDTAADWSEKGPVFSWLHTETRIGGPESPEGMSEEKGGLIRALFGQSEPRWIFGTGYEVLKEKLEESRILSSYLQSGEKTDAAPRFWEQTAEEPEKQGTDASEDAGTRMVRRIQELSSGAWRIFVEELWKGEDAEVIPGLFRTSGMGELHGQAEQVLPLAEEKRRVLEYLDRKTERITEHEKLRTMKAAAGTETSLESGKEVPGAWTGRAEAAPYPEAAAREGRRMVQMAERVLALLKMDRTVSRDLSGLRESILENRGSDRAGALWRDHADLAPDRAEAWKDQSGFLEAAAESVIYRGLEEMEELPLAEEKRRGLEYLDQKEGLVSEMVGDRGSIGGTEAGPVSERHTVKSWNEKADAEADSGQTMEMLPLPEEKPEVLEFLKPKAGGYAGLETAAEDRTAALGFRRQSSWMDREIQIRTVLREIRGKAMELFSLPPRDPVLWGHPVYLKTSADPLWQPKLQEGGEASGSWPDRREAAIHTLERLRQKRIAVEREEKGMDDPVDGPSETKAGKALAVHDGSRAEQREVDSGSQRSGMQEPGIGRSRQLEEQMPPAYDPADMVVNQGAGASRRQEELPPAARMSMNQEIQQQVKEEITDIQFITRSQTVTQEGNVQDRLQLENLLRRMESQEKELERIKRDQEAGNEGVAEARVSRSVMKKLQDQMQMERLRRGL